MKGVQIMNDTMDWLYFHYILPAMEEEPQGEYAEHIEKLQSMLDIPHKINLEMAVEFYASCAFRLGLRTGCPSGRFCRRSGGLGA